MRLGLLLCPPVVNNNFSRRDLCGTGSCWKSKRLIKCEPCVSHALSTCSKYPSSRHIPTIVVQGRYDVVCPVSFDLSTSISSTLTCSNGRQRRHMLLKRYNCSSGIRLLRLLIEILIAMARDHSEYRPRCRPLIPRTRNYQNACAGHRSVRQFVTVEHN